MPQTKPLTPNQARARIRLKGITLTQWAKDHGFPRDAVYRVLGGQFKAHFGRAHDIAVALRMKVPTDDRSTSTDAGNTQDRDAA